MPLDIVRGKISNIVATKELIKIVEQHGITNAAKPYI